MHPAFTVFTDPNGDLMVCDGMVAQLRTGVRLAIGEGTEFDPGIFDRRPSWFTAARAPASGTFVGGSGRNLVATGLSIPLSGAMPPVGIFRPRRPNFFHLGAFWIEVSGSSSAVICDATDIVAELTTGGTAPVGNYAATAYGKTTYNGGADFTIAVALEIAGGGAIPDRDWTVSAGTAPAGTMTAIDAANFTDSSDTDWTVVVNADGTADLLYLTTIIASRAVGSDHDPDGNYVATADGMTDYNSGEPWSAFIRSVTRPPRAGFAYVKITESAGVLTNTEGPYFATSLPADSGENYHVPIAQSDGTNIEQFHTGLLIVDASTRGGKIPSAYDEMTTPVTTTSATLEDIAGVSTTITLAAASEIAVWLNCAVSSDGICDLGLAVNIDGTDHDEVITHMNGTTDSGVSSVIHRSGELAAGTYTIKGRFRRISGSPKIPGVDRADMLVMALRGPAGPPGTGPSGTGLVSVLNGIYETPSTLRDRVAADAANLRTDLGLETSTTKTTPVDADTIEIKDSEASSARKLLSFANLWAWIKSKIDAGLTWAGNQTFSGQIQLSAQAATDDASAMTRGLSDTRYKQVYLLRLTSAVSAASTALVSGSETLTLPAGTYQFETSGTSITASTTGGINMFAAFSSSDTNTLGTLIQFANSGIGVNGTPVMYNRQGTNMIQYLVFYAYANEATAAKKTCSAIAQGTVTFAASVTITPKIQQRVTDASNPAVLQIGSYMLFRKIA
jgi:hypothetical protein